MPPEVTVLTAVRNGARFLPETIASIRRQTFDDLEYIVVDDASDDQSPQVVEDAMRSDARIRLLRRHERGGPYAAANHGLRDARGRFIVRIDADDVAVPERIERQVAFLVRTGLRACASWFRVRSADGALSSEVGDVPGSVRALKWRLCVRHELAHSTACTQRVALEEIGGYRELPAAQDLRMWCDLARRDWLGVVPEVLVHLRRPGGLTGAAPELQERLALEAQIDHMNELRPEQWSEEEVRALRPSWTGQPAGTRIAALARWAGLWRADSSLSRDDRTQLARLERRVYWEILRQALRREGPSLGTLRTVLRTGPKHLVRRAP
jgi:glycosyltransferase involved in cell wall biosynthesis